jgi:hypothetical protein
MMITVFKDKIPKGINYPFPLEFLKGALPGAADQAIALYFVHGSHWVLGKHNMSQQRLHDPRALLSVGTTRPMFRNNNQKKPAGAEAYDWHLVAWATPSEIRHDLQKQFQNVAAQPLLQWFVDRKPRSKGAHVWWYPETQKISVGFL